MAGLMDFILSLVKFLCSTPLVEEEPQALELQKRPPNQRLTTQPRWTTPEHCRQEQEWKPTTSQPLSSRPEHKSRQDQNQVNQHAEHYEALRAKANEHGDLMARYFQESHEAYNRGNHARAKEELQAVEFQKRPPDQQRPATQPQWTIPERRRQEQEWEPTTSQPLSSRPEHKPRQDQNQVNQHVEHYEALRAKANEHGDLMARSFQESHEAYDRGDHTRAKEMSAEGKQHERKMGSLNAEASAWIFRQNNMDSKPGEIDLHGLYVKEAVSYAEKSVEEARRRGDAEIRLVVGKGLHSDGHVAKIKPAIEDLMRKHNIPTEIDPHNGGVLVARLS